MTEIRTQPPEPATAAAPSDIGRRPQPPLREVLDGLEARELEGQTVFDQLFGPPPTAPAPDGLSIVSEHRPGPRTAEERGWQKAGPAPGPSGGPG